MNDIKVTGNWKDIKELFYSLKKEKASYKIKKNKDKTWTIFF